MKSLNANYSILIPTSCRFTFHACFFHCRALAFVELTTILFGTFTVAKKNKKLAKVRTFHVNKLCFKDCLYQLLLQRELSLSLTNAQHVGGRCVSWLATIISILFVAKRAKFTNPHGQSMILSL